VKRALFLTVFLGAAGWTALANQAATDPASPPPPVAAPSIDVPAPPPPDLPATPVTHAERVAWFEVKTFGLSNFGGSLPGVVYGTLVNQPHEAGDHWPGFAERYGVSLSSYGLGNAIEAGLGAAWGEDPRYLRRGDAAPFTSRVGRAIKWTFVAPNRHGGLSPAYGRFLGIAGSSFISNYWREPSDASTGNEVGRIAFGYAARMVGNAYEEFWPDTKQWLFHRRRN